MPTDRAAVALPRVKQLAEDNGRALDRAYRLLASGALEGPAADALYEGMASRHRTIRSMFLSAFDEVRRLAARSPDGAPSIMPPALGPPQGPPLSRPGVGSGDPDLLNLLGIEVGRAGRAWEDAGHELSRLLGWLGLSGGPGQSIARSGGWIAGQRGDLERRRDDLVKAGVASPTIPQPAQPPPQTKSTGGLGGAWNKFAHHFVPGLWDVAKDNTKNAFATNPVTSPFYMLYDREDWQHRQLTTITLNLAKGLRDPKQLGENLAKGIVDYDTFKKDKFRWAGHILPDVVIGIATLGEGTGFKAAQRAATRSAESLTTKFGSVSEKTATKVESKLADESKASEDAGRLPGGGGVPITPALREAQEFADAVGRLHDVRIDYLTHPIDAAAAQAVNSALSQLADEYPSVFRTMDSVRSESRAAINDYNRFPLDDDVRAFSRSLGQTKPDTYLRDIPRGIVLVREWFEDRIFFERIGTELERVNFFAPGSGSVRGTIFHEFGHQVFWKIMGGGTHPGILAAKTEIEDAIKRVTGGAVMLEAAGIGTASRNAATAWADWLSSYGAKNPREFFAEAFAEWKTADNPRELAEAVGSVIDKHLKEVR